MKTNTSIRMRFLAFGSSILPCLVAGCSGSTEAPSAFLACSVGEIRIEGEIDGQTVSISQSTESSGLGQTESRGSFFTGESTNDGRRVTLSIDWAPAVVDGRTSQVTSATLVMPNEPATVAFAGQTFCAQGGSQIRIPEKSENVGNLQFNLAPLTGGIDCAEAHTGTLRGCWRPDRP